MKSRTRRLRKHRKAEREFIVMLVCREDGSWRPRRIPRERGKHLLSDRVFVKRIYYGQCAELMYAPLFVHGGKVYPSKRKALKTRDLPRLPGDL